MIAIILPITWVPNEIESNTGHTAKKKNAISISISKKKKNRLEKQEDDGKACDVGVSDPIPDSDRATERAKFRSDRGGGRR